MKIKLLLAAILTTLILILIVVIRSNSANDHTIVINIPKHQNKPEPKGEGIKDFLKGESRLGRAMKKSSDDYNSKLSPEEQKDRAEFNELWGKQ